MDSTVNTCGGRSKKAAVKKICEGSAVSFPSLNNPLSVGGAFTSTASQNNQNTFCLLSTTPANKSTATGELPVNSLKFSELDEELQGLFGELEESEICFKEMVTLIRAADKTIFGNLEKLQCLNQAVNELAELQTEVCVDLKAIRSYLNVYDKAVEGLEGCGVTGSNQPPIRCGDILRENIYNAALQTNGELNFLHSQLANLIVASRRTEVVGHSQEGNPLLQIGVLLNHHYECLVEMDNTFNQRQNDIKKLHQMLSSLQLERHNAEQHI